MSKMNRIFFQSIDAKFLCSLIFFVLLSSVSSGQNSESKKFKIVAFGDSITAPRKDVLTYSDILRSELKNVNVINAGIGGNTTDHAKKRFERDVISLAPDLVIIQFGNNDAAVDVWKDPPATGPRVKLDEYVKNINEMIAALKKRDVKIILVTPLPTRWTPKLKDMYGKPPYDPSDPNGFNYLKKEYIAALRKIAAHNRIPLIDLYSEYFKYDKRKGQAMDELFTDGMHPNSAGHRIEAGLLMKQIRKFKVGAI